MGKHACRRQRCEHIDAHDNSAAFNKKVMAHVLAHTSFLFTPGFHLLRAKKDWEPQLMRHPNNAKRTQTTQKELFDVAYFKSAVNWKSNPSGCRDFNRNKDKCFAAGGAITRDMLQVVGVAKRRREQGMQPDPTCAATPTRPVALCDRKRAGGDGDNGAASEDAGDGGGAAEADVGAACAGRKGMAKKNKRQQREAAAGKHDEREEELS